METVPVPRRVLLVSAAADQDAASVLAGQVRRLWPGSEVSALRFGPVAGGGPTAGRLGTWLYQVSYAPLLRHRTLAAVTRRLCGAWVGRGLVPWIELFDPDLIGSTTPLGTAGLGWLRHHRGLGLPLGAWVPDVAPHPLSLHPELDLHLVPHPAAVPLAAAALPEAQVVVAAPPTSRPGDRAGTLRRYGLDPARPVVLVACGPLRPAAMVEAVRALVSPAEVRQVVTVCGRGDRPAHRLARRLTGVGGPRQRPLVLVGPVDDITSLVGAADVLVTNDGGATARRALAAGTPVVIYRPTTPYGIASAGVLTYAGLAETCRTPQQLAAVVRATLATPPAVGAPPAGLAGSGLPTLAAQPAPAAGRPRRAPSWPLRSQDAFFQYVETPTVAQQIGAVLDLDPRPDGRPLGLADLAGLLRQRLPTLPTLRRQVVARGRWARPGWRLVTPVDLGPHLLEHQLSAGEAAGAVIDEFWTVPLPPDRPLWQLLLVTGLPGGRVRLAIKLHHSLGDGLSAIGTLQRLLDPVPGEPDDQTGRDRGGGSQRVGERPGKALQLALVARGMLRLARAGRAPRSGFNRPLPSPRRRLVTTTLPAAAVHRAARTLPAHPSALVCALVAEALRRTYPGALPPALRATFAVTSRTGPRAPTQGNWTGAVALDLPLSPMPLDARVDLVSDRLRRGLASGQPLAAELVMRALGRLPGRLHAAAARLIYTHRFMNIIVSYVPGPAGPQRLVGAPVTAAAPVVALAGGVPLGVGVMRWAGGFGIGVLLDAWLDGALTGHGEGFVAALHEALDQLSADRNAPGRLGTGVQEVARCE